MKDYYKGLAFLANPFFLGFMKPLSVKYQLMLLAAIVLAVFYPSLFAEVSVVDDAQTITTVLNSDHFTLQDIFFPRSSGGGYYRPLIAISYWLDKHLWFLEGGLMHFEGIIAHLLNGFLVFFITREILVSRMDINTSYLPLASGLLFSIHPVVTESVNWISGRTDIMMGNFVLCSFLLLMKYRRSREKSLLTLALASACAALLTKEAAFGYLLGLPLLLACKDERGANTTTGRKLKVYTFMACYASALLAALYLGNFWLVLAIVAFYAILLIRLESCRTAAGADLRQSLWLVAAALVVSIAVFYVARRAAYMSDVDKIGQTLKLMFADMNYTISLFLGAMGFYVKKFFLPLPLNFFITEVDPLYDFAGIAVLLLVIYLIIARSLPAVIALLGLFMLMPALPFSFGTIAWTAYAERYIYLSTAFWSIAVCISLHSILHHQEKRARIFSTLAAFGILISSAGITYARNMVWQTNVALLSNTVELNPKNRMLRYVYLDALLGVGNVVEAKMQYLAAASLPPAFYHNIYDDRGDLLIGAQLSREGNHGEALKIYENALVKTKYGSENMLVAALQEIKILMPGVTDKRERARLEIMQADFSMRLQNMTSNPHRLIEFGKIAMQRGSFLESAQLFEKALEKMPPNDRLRPLVSTYLKQATAR